jgi:hypothetical protein
MNTEDKDEKELASAALALRKFKDSMPMFLELAVLQAKLARSRYVALINAGFTEDQALRLCTVEIKL